VDHQLQEILPEAEDGQRQYYRFQARLDVGNDDMDDASNTNIRVLRLLAEDMLQANRAVLRNLADRLLVGAPDRPEAPPPNTAADAPPPTMTPQEAKAAGAREVAAMDDERD